MCHVKSQKTLGTIKFSPSHILIRASQKWLKKNLLRLALITSQIRKHNGMLAYKKIYRNLSENYNTYLERIFSPSNILMRLAKNGKNNLAQS